MSNSRFLQWLYDRMQYVYNNDPNTDYMLRLEKIIAEVEAQEAKDEGW